MTVINDTRLNDFLEHVKEKAIGLRIGVCPIWQCGGILEYIEERVNWQEPDLKCMNCKAEWKLVKRPK